MGFNSRNPENCEHAGQNNPPNEQIVDKKFILALVVVLLLLSKVNTILEVSQNSGEKVLACSHK